MLLPWTIVLSSGRAALTGLGGTPKCFRNGTDARRRAGTRKEIRMGSGAGLSDESSVGPRRRE